MCKPASLGPPRFPFRLRSAPGLAWKGSAEGRRRGPLETRGARRDGPEESATLPGGVRTRASEPIPTSSRRRHVSLFGLASAARSRHPYLSYSSRIDASDVDPKYDSRLSSCHGDASNRGWKPSKVSRGDTTSLSPSPSAFSHPQHSGQGDQTHKLRRAVLKLLCAQHLVYELRVVIPIYAYVRVRGGMYQISKPTEYNHTSHRPRTVRD